MAEHTLTSYGAVANAREVRDAAIATGTNVLNSASAPFTAGDVGKAIVVSAAGAAGAKLRTTIASFVSPTQVTLANNAVITATAAGAVFGSDCSAALQAALDAIATGGGGTVVIDGRFFLASPVSKAFGGETSSTAARLIGTGQDSAIWIGVPDSADAISITSGGLEIHDVNFIGVPGASRDARRVLNLSALKASLEHCGFFGMMAQEAVIYASNSYLDTRECFFGGCFVASPSGYSNSVIENKSWVGYRDNYSQFLDYGYYQGQYYTKSSFSSTLGWIRADTPLGEDGARGDSVFHLQGTRLDEGALHGVVVKPTTGSIAHVRLSGVRQNVSPGETGRGIHCQSVQWAVLEQCWQGWAGTPALSGHFQDCGTVLIDSLKLSDAVNGLSAFNVSSLTLKDSPGISTFAFTNVNFHPVTSRFADVSLIKDGAIADQDFPATPAQGTMGFDRSNNRLYIKRVNVGGWIYFDMSGGDPLGPELVVNGTFDNGTTGWTAANSAVLSVVSGALRVTNGAIHGRAYQAVPTAIGQTYQVSVGIIGGNGVPLVRVGTTQGSNNYAQFTGTGGTATFTALGTTTYIALMLTSEVVGRYADFDNVTLRAI